MAPRERSAAGSCAAATCRVGRASRLSTSAGNSSSRSPASRFFPALGDDSILKPALDWILYSAQPAKFDAEVSYVSGGMTWNADYNIVAPETGDILDLVGWVTLDNQSGKQFDHARVKLMAGDVNKVQPGMPQRVVMGGVAGGIIGGPPQVEEKTFEDYHLYSLPQPTTLRDRETKQVEFLRAAGVQSKRSYIYDGMRPDRNFNPYGDIRQVQQYGTQSNPHVWVMREFVNGAGNHLGIPLPKGRVRFYRRDADGQVEFTGENQIDHTAKGRRRCGSIRATLSTSRASGGRPNIRRR